MKDIKKLTIPTRRPEDVPALKNRQLDFESVAQMFTVRAQEVPKKNHVIFYDERITYEQTNERANKIANYLKEKGIAKGEVISLMISNSPEVYYTMFGIQKIGAVAGVINFALMGPEIAHVLDDSKPRLVFVGSEFMDVFAKACDLAAHRPVIVEVTKDADHTCDLAEQTLLDILAKHPADEALVPQKSDDPFLLLYSSGTTGLPKGIVLTNKGQLDICRAMSTIGMFTSTNETMLLLLPMFHINPIGVWTYPVTFIGQTLCIRKAFSPQDFWPAIIENDVTIVMGVPAMYSYVYHSIDASKIDMSKLKLRYVFCGAAPLSVELIKGFKEKFNVEIIEGYGLTEATGVSTANPPAGKRKPGSCGLPMPGQEISIMDYSGKILASGEKGEVCIKGDNTMMGYLENPKATQETMGGGWLHTGDIGYLDEDGYLYVVDRKKDMINRGGENIYPREIEIAIESHPDVNAVAVVGVPDEGLGERVKAVIEPFESKTITHEIITKYLKDKLAHYKIPELVEVTGSLPRNQTGKILKYKLRENKKVDSPNLSN